MPSAASSYAAYHRMVEQERGHRFGKLTSRQHGAAMKAALEPMVAEQLAAEAGATSKLLTLPSGKTVTVTTVE
jgi:hypothetical protein